MFTFTVILGVTLYVCSGVDLCFNCISVAFHTFYSLSTLHLPVSEMDERGYKAQPLKVLELAHA